VQGATELVKRAKDRLADAIREKQKADTRVTAANAVLNTAEANLQSATDITDEELVSPMWISPGDHLIIVALTFLYEAAFRQAVRNAEREQQAGLHDVHLDQLLVNQRQRDHQASVDHYNAAFLVWWKCMLKNTPL